jgi:hypothetical protein
LPHFGHVTVPFGKRDDFIRFKQLGQEKRKIVSMTCPQRSDVEK